MPAKTCPSRDELSTYVRGMLPVPQADAVTEHLAACPNCEDTIHELASTSDSLIERIQPPTAAQPYVDEAACRKVVESVKRHPPAAVGEKEPAAPPVAARPAPVTSASEPARTMNRTEFVEFLTTTGFVSSTEMTAIEQQLPPAEAADVQALARVLVQQGKLTKYQAAAVYQGKGKSLVFGEHVVLDRIGAGGMGQVFKAMHRRMDRIVALKVMSTAAMKNADSVKRFEREVRAAAKLAHPNIVHAYDAGRQDGVHFLVMEFVDGPDLSSLVKKQGKLPIKQACDFITQAARGFAFAHGKGIVHRDIKPGNLLVDRDGTVKILDMGLARFDDGGIGGVMSEAELTQSGAVMGTVDYMAPEQALNTSRADAKSDVYGLGCTLYRLVTGESAYGGQTMVEKILAHREQPIPILRQHRPDAPLALEALVTRMMAKKPDDRPTMQEVAETLADMQRETGDRKQGTGDEKPHLAASPVVSGVERLATRSPVPPPIAAPVVRPVAASIPPAVRNVSSAKPQAKGVPPKRRNPTPLLVAAGAGAVLIACGVWFIFKDKFGNETARVELPDGGTVQTAVVGVPPSGGISSTQSSEPAKAGTPAQAPTAVAAASSEPNKFFALPQSKPTANATSSAIQSQSIAPSLPKPTSGAESSVSVAASTYTHDFLLLGDGTMERWPTVGEASWKQLFSGRTVENRAKLRSTIEQKIEELNGDVTSLHPRVIIAQVGYASITAGTADVSGIYRAYVAQLRQRFPQSALVLATIILPGSAQAKSLELNDTIRSLADGKTVFLADAATIRADQQSSQYYEQYSALLKPNVDRLLVAATTASAPSVPSSPISFPAAAGGPSPLDALKRESVTAEALQAIGFADPAQAPTELVLALAGSQVNGLGKSRSVALSPDFWTLAAGGEDGSTRLVDVVTGTIRKTMRRDAGESGYAVVDFSPDGSLVATATHDPVNYVTLWDAATGSAVLTTTGRPGHAGAIRFSPDGKTVAHGATQNYLQLVDVATGARLKTFGAYKPYQGNITWSADSNLIASGKVLWSVVTGTTVKQFVDDGPVDLMSFSPDGRWMAAVLAEGEDRSVKIWDLNARRARTTLNDTAERISAKTFHPTGRILAGADSQKSVRLWDVESGNLIRSIPLGFTPNRLYFDASGRYLAGIGIGGQVAILRLSDAATPAVAVVASPSRGAPIASSTALPPVVTVRRPPLPPLPPAIGAGLPPAEQLKLIVAKLSEVNGKPIKLESQRIENNQIVMLGFHNAGIVNIEPLIGLPLKVLSLYGSKGLTGDLTALRGMPLEDLNLQYCEKLDSLHGIEGAPLRKLNCYQCPSLTGDLTVLQGMPLEDVSFRYCKKITSLHGLEGAPLTNLSLYQCSSLTGDLSVLRQAKLKSLDVHYCDRLEGLNGIQGQPLVSIDIQDCPKLKTADHQIIAKLTTLERIVTDKKELGTQLLAAVAANRGTAPVAPVVAPATIAAPVTPSVAVAARQTVPESKDQQAALALLKEAFKDDYTAAKASDKKTAFASKLLQQAQQAVDPIERYVLLNEARAMAVDGDDHYVLRNTLAAIVGGYDVDATTTYVDAWKAMLAKTKPAATVRGLYDDATKHFDETVANAKFDDAKKYGDFLTTTAPRLSDAAAVKLVRERNLALAARQQEYTAAKAAVEKLVTSPDDAEANLAVGRYRALVEGDWQNALPLLAKGSDELWKDLAAKSLAAGPDAAARAAVGDAWWDAAQTKTAQKAELTAAALYWYQASISSITGLQKVRIEKRIADAASIVPQRKIPPTMLPGLAAPVAPTTPGDDKPFLPNRNFGDPMPTPPKQ